MDAEISNRRWEITKYCERGNWIPSEPFIVLEANVRPNDFNWNYTIEYETDLLSPSYQLHSGARGDETENQARNRKLLMKCIRVTNEDIVLSKEPIPPNRMTMNDNPDNFIYVSFNKLKFRGLPGERNWDFDFNLTSNYIKEFLTRGITLNGVTYVFFGHSNSQLKSRCCYLRVPDDKVKQNFLQTFIGLFKPEKHPMDDKINACGRFKEIKTVATRAKRISLLFTACESTVEINPEEIKTIDDVTRRQEIFSDGCGCIDIELAKKLYKNFPPSVFQIRYQGFKGVLVATHSSEINRLLKEGRPILKKFLDAFSPPVNQNEPLPKILFRKSMEKFTKCFDAKSLCIIECSRPFKYGYLNSDLITLLSTIGIKDAIFERKLEYYLDVLRNCTIDNTDAIQFSILKGRLNLAKIIKRQKSIPYDTKEKLTKLRNETYRAFLEKEGKIKIRVWVPKSRLLFGVCDFTGKLKEGECFIQFTVANEGTFEPEVRQLTGDIVVSRNPCLHPGDIKMFSAVDEYIPELDHLVDCIVFSVKGKTPAPALMSGGDLDGDKFFVCWDPDLIPDAIYKSADYAQFGPKLVEKEKITHTDLLNYFANYNTFSLSQTKILYMHWVRGTKERALSPQCIRLNAIHSKCVDGEPIEIPQDLRRYPPPIQPEFIVDVLERRINRTLAHDYDVSDC